MRTAYSHRQQQPQRRHRRTRYQRRRRLIGRGCGAWGLLYRCILLTNT
ncbi:hypothetical protein [Salisaeta icosahedral phage 1]|nr:hypothetical protein A322_gp51 [Salisaeta icosahedral phage 1]AFJ21506.1 hypothetical protein [Salisaeta icosahedral phage 1]